MTLTHSGVEALVAGLHAPLWSAQDGATSGAPVNSHAFWLLPLLHTVLYCDEVVAASAHVQVRGAIGGYGGTPGGLGSVGGSGGGESAGGGGDGEGGGIFANTAPRRRSSMTCTPAVLARRAPKTSEAAMRKGASTRGVHSVGV